MPGVKTLIDIMMRGGPVVMLPLFLTGIIVWYIGVDRLLFMRRVLRARRGFLEMLKTAPVNDGCASVGLESYDTLGAQLEESLRTGRGEKAARQLFREFLVELIPQLEQGFSAMSAWITVAPLLGLLGTVMGMVQTFRVITIFGVGNPNLMAEGIGIALNTTEAGLTVAFPAMLFHNYLVTRKEDIKARLLCDGEALVGSYAARAAQRPVEAA